MDGFSPSYRGKLGTWCRDCFAAYKRGDRGTSAVHQPITCDHCGEQYTPRQLKSKAAYCSRICKERATKNRLIAERLASKPTDRTCLHCATLLPQDARIDAVFCSRSCNWKAHALQRKLRARTGQKGKPGYLRAEICERDEWRCKICEMPVDRALGHPHPMSASIDHVVPVCRGGDNSLSNLRLTHLRCNLSRGARDDKPTAANSSASEPA